MKPVTHGYESAEMYNLDLKLDMNGRVIQAYHFDSDDKFVGLTLTDETMLKERHYLAREFDLEWMSSSKEEFNDAYDINAAQVYDTTRLIGFRTSKSCKQADHISMVQPIYYSIDEQVCKEYLTPLTPGMHNELPSWGNDCSDLTMQAVADKIWEHDFSNKGEVDSFGMIFYLVLTCLVLVLITLLCQWRSWCKDRYMRRLAKLEELKSSGNSN